MSALTPHNIMPLYISTVYYMLNKVPAEPQPHNIHTYYYLYQDIYDPPHLLKNVQNNLKKSDMKVGDKIVDSILLTSTTLIKGKKYK